MEYKIITDGSCDLGTDRATKLGVDVVPFYVSFDDENYMKEIVDINIRDFYQQMVDNPTCFPKSSLPSVQDYIDVFELYAKDNIPVICICITTKFSGSYNSAINAKEVILETYPEARIEVIDSTINTVLQGIFVDEAVRMQQNGISYEDNIDNLNKIKSTGRILFTVGNLDYLIHGGRIGKVMGIAANTLGIKPMIILKDGEIFSNGIARSRKKSLDKLIAQVKEHFKSNSLDADNYKLVIGYGYDYDEAVKFKDRLLESMNEYCNITDIELYQIGATIGVHTGPYPLGIGLLQRYDK